MKGISLDWWDKFRFCFYSGLGAAATQMASVMANTEETSITGTLIVTTVLTFLIHYSKESKNFIQAKINKSDIRGD